MIFSSTLEASFSASQVSVIDLNSPHGDRAKAREQNASYEIGAMQKGFSVAF